MPLISHPQKVGFFLALALAPIFIIFAYYGRPDQGFILMCIAGVFATVAYVKRKIIDWPYILLTILALFISEMAILFTIGFPKEHFPGIVMLPVAIINVALVFAVLRVVEVSMMSGDG